MSIASGPSIFMNNPSLKVEPRYQPAPVLPSTGEASILDWLENSGRLLPRDGNDPELPGSEEEIEAFLGGDDGGYDDLDDDDDDFELED